MTKLLALLLTAMGSIVLGMGLPTTAAYVVLAALGAPALIQLGVPTLGAHLFIFYFGLMSMVTPPVALAAFAAATISGAGAIATGLAAMRIGWARTLKARSCAPPERIARRAQMRSTGRSSASATTRAMAMAATITLVVGRDLRKPRPALGDREE